MQISNFSLFSLREKCPNTEFFLVRIFLYSDWIRRFSPNSLWIQKKYGSEKTPYLNTFHAVFECLMNLMIMWFVRLLIDGKYLTLPTRGYFKGFTKAFSLIVRDGTGRVNMLLRFGWNHNLTLMFHLDVNECASNPCSNGGRCINGQDYYQCECRQGFFGFDCQYEIDECLSNPCTAGSTCIDEIGKYRCICVDGFTGNNCSGKNRFL